MKQPFLCLELDIILLIHHAQINQHGGSTGIRDKAALIAALHRPIALYYYEPKTQLPVLAAYYALSITQAHPFIDGNKRTALVACHTFLRNNNYSLEATTMQKYNQLIGISNGSIKDNDFIEWVIQHTVATKLP